MKKLIKSTTALLIAVIIVAVTILSAGAASYTSQADALNKLGLLKGNANGYDLDRESTRAEAATMLVRLLGKEQDALAGSYTNSFTDVPAWASHYIGYLYANGLTNGTSATTFSPNGKCDATMYTVFVLRALGYSDKNGDFTYAGALNFASKLGLINASLASKATFLRDDMVAVSYAALFMHPKGADTLTLLDQLVAANAVSADAAKSYLDSYKTFQDFVKSMTPSPLPVPAQLQEDISIQANVAGKVMNGTESAVITIAKSGDGYVQKTETTADMFGTISKTTTYSANGWVYMDTDQGKFKQKAPTINPEGNILSSDLGSFSVIGSISKSTAGNGVTYTLQLLPEAINNMLESYMPSLSSSLSSAVDIQINSAKLVVSLDANGKLSSENLDADITENVTAYGQTIPVKMTMQMKLSVVKTGGDITVTLPSDLSSYQDVTAAK